MTDTSTNHPLGDFVRSQITDPQIAACVNGLIGILLLMVMVALMPNALIWVERKVCAHFQARLGPMRVGWHGLLQPFADGIKLLLKEFLRPTGADKFIFILAPFLPATASFMILMVIPFDHNIQLVDLDVGVIYVIAISGFGICGMLIGGWASNNKYSLIGALRSGSQMLSYEISIALGMLLIVLLSGSASLREIVLSQEGPFWNWWILKLPLLGFVAFIVFLVSSTAELNRAPFDLPEAESEITAGFHTEYSGITFAMFFLAEFINMFIAAALCSSFFLGGFLPFLVGIEVIDNIMIKIPGWIWFGSKTSFIIFVFMWFRWSFPRPRLDQLLNLEWKFLLPLNLMLLMGASLFMIFGWIL